MGRRRKRHPVRRVGGEAQAVIVSLHAPVARARRAAVAGLDERQQAARCLASLHIRVHRHDELMLRGLRANAVERLAVGGICFAADVIRNLRPRHQIAFVARVDKHFRAVHVAIRHRDRGDASALLLHRREPLIKINRHFRLLEQLVENLPGDVRLEGPHRRV